MVFISGPSRNDDVVTHLPSNFRVPSLTQIRDLKIFASSFSRQGYWPTAGGAAASDSAPPATSCILSLFLSCWEPLPLPENDVCSLMYQGGGTPECYCGAGKMELRCAGPKAMNAGRYYLKCPANDNHPKSFMWFDEFLHDNKRRNKEVTGKHIREGRPAAVRDHRCSKGSRAHGTQSSSNTEMKVNVLLCLVCLLLVAACILIGKLM
ncbi:uncharacterized protein LOC121750669 [Salvia splendens]|uniref:uncharacterized protein LOC121750669 n=1 Tax=Salvia splendens TaxID=180675 RepID=UPI001C251853|nr:uncharacterized protein LOC121750669 [Salvia splendens]